jgi:hypothetical protein
VPQFGEQLAERYEFRTLRLAPARLAYCLADLLSNLAGGCLSEPCPIGKLDIFVIKVNIRPNRRVELDDWRLALRHGTDHRLFLEPSSMR